MYTARKIAPRIIWSFAWKSVLFFASYATLLTTLHVVAGWSLGLPFMPIGLIGSAVAFYVGFKNNSSYERLWEARKIWGGVVNSSRTWGAYITSYIPAKTIPSKSHPTALPAEFIYRHLAYLETLTMQLRSKSVWGGAIEIKKGGKRLDRSFLMRHYMATLLPKEEVEGYLDKKNAATQILKTQANRLDDLFRQNIITERSYVQLMNLVQEFYNLQGASERIKNFPFPRQYAYFSVLFVWLFILLLPFGLLKEFGELGGSMIWFTIPAHVLIAWVFNSMEVIGDTSENPFENQINDIPLTAICRTVEIDLREMLGESDIPEPIKPVENILM